MITKFSLFKEGLLSKMKPKTDEEFLDSLKELDDPKKIMNYSIDEDFILGIELALERGYIDKYGIRSILLLNRDLRDEIIKKYNSILKVKGDLDLSGYNITSLPDGLTVNRDLDLSKTYIKTLPNDLKVGRHLDLGNTPITSLPNDLIINGDLILNYSDITALPNGLIVNGDLTLFGTSITTLPNDLNVKGEIYGFKK